MTLRLVNPADGYNTFSKFETVSRRPCTSMGVESATEALPFIVHQDERKETKENCKSNRPSSFVILSAAKNPYALDAARRSNPFSPRRSSQESGKSIATPAVGGFFATLRMTIWRVEE